jgi:hypothetical protein
MLTNNGFVNVALYGSSRVNTESLRSKVTSFLKQTAVFLNLMPKTMKGKQFLKRIFFGKLYPIPFEIREGMAIYEKPVPLLPDFKNNNYKVVYAVAHKE